MGSSGPVPQLVHGGLEAFVVHEEVLPVLAQEPSPGQQVPGFRVEAGAAVAAVVPDPTLGFSNLTALLALDEQFRSNLN